VLEMKDISLIPVSLIIMDRHALRPNTLSLIKHFEHGGVVPPIHVMRLDGGRYKICDGRHRVTAHKLMGRELIKACYNKKNQP
jgi:ParB-like chromosome segregation protein Spo0J